MFPDQRSTRKLLMKGILLNHLGQQARALVLCFVVIYSLQPCGYIEIRMLMFKLRTLRQVARLSCSRQSCAMKSNFI